MDGASAVIETGHAATGDVRHPDLGIVDLSVARTTLELPHDLDHLRHAGRADRVPLRQEAAARIYRNATPQ